MRYDVDSPSYRSIPTTMCSATFTILLWTLNRVTRTGLCSDRSLPTIRAAHRCLESNATLRPFMASDCEDRVYSRLNADYEPMHRLCRFFLDHCGPTHEHGNNDMLPFLVHMPQLFEGFVGAWLEEHAKGRYRVDTQYRIVLNGTPAVDLVADVVLFDSSTGRALAVLDTKYKRDAAPSNADVSQVVTYAQALGCPQAILVYPVAHMPFHIDVGDISVTAASFVVDDGLEVSGRRLLFAIERVIDANEADGCVSDTEASAARRRLTSRRVTRGAGPGCCSGTRRRRRGRSRSPRIPP